MKTSIAKNVEITPALSLALEEVAKIDTDGHAEVGFDEVDDKGPAIVWAAFPYFAEKASLRSMRGWITATETHYHGSNLNGEEWQVPLADPQSAEKAAKLMTKPMEFLVLLSFS